MLARVHRLRRSEDFSLAVRRGRKVGRRCLVVHLWNPPTAPAGAEPTGARVGFVVSKTVGSAVDRNRVKRRLRHLVAERVSDLPPDSLLVVRALPAAATTSFEGLEADLHAALDRAVA